MTMCKLCDTYSAGSSAAQSFHSIKGNGAFINNNMWAGLVVEKVIQRDYQ